MPDQIQKLAQDIQLDFSGGMDSYTNPQILPRNMAMYLENIVCRGGIAQTRPGNMQIFGLPCGNLQGLVSFIPTGGKPQLVWAVEGKIYVSEAPFNFYRQLPNLQFYKNAKFVAWAVCLQSTYYNASGELINLNAPKAVLVIQDGFTRAAYYDGSTNMHLNPAPSGVIDPVSGEGVVTPNTYGTPVGLWMAWSNNRLWVSRNNQVFASDIGNPLVFSEQTYLSGFPSFNMPEPVTGMVEPYYGSPLIVFGQTTRTFLRSDIQDRTQWGFSNMQRSEYGIGCVSHRSIIRQYGMIWWYAQGGMVNLNQATQNLIDSYADYIDSAMMVSKSYLSPDTSVMAGIGFEKYLLLSVPSRDVKNYHTWVLDQADIAPGGGPFDTAGLVWNGVWTGTRPVEWASVNVAGQPRCFYVSADEDGVNRLWEAFSPDRTDNGMPITSVLQSRFFDFGEMAGPDNIKDYNFNRVEAKEILGVVDVYGGYCGTRGAYVQNLTKRIVATAGTYDAVQNNAAIDTYKPQTRVFDSQADMHNSTACNQCDVEAQEGFYRDRAFGVLLIWSGRMGVTGLRMFADAGSYDEDDASCTPAESIEQPRSLAWDGCEATQAIVTEQPFTIFTASAEATAECSPYAPGTGPTHGVGAATSLISQDNANLLALRRAEQDALDVLQCS